VRFLNDFNKALGFTPQESRIVLFLVVTFLAGIGIRIVKPAGNGESKFDYAASDSEFEARSQLLAAMDTAGSDSPGFQESALRDLDSSGRGRHPISAKRLSPRSININTASREELTRLPGIGAAMAERILAYREENGSFSSIDELINVKGIGRKKLDRIKQYCTLGR